MRARLTPVQLQMLQVAQADGIPNVHGMISPRTLRVLDDLGLVMRVVGSGFRSGVVTSWVTTRLGDVVLERRGRIKP